MHQLDFGLMGDYPQDVNMRLAKLGDHYGFHSVWCAEENPAPGFRHTLVTAAAVSLASNNLQIVLGNLNPYSQHIGLIAVGTNSIALLSKGRCRLCIAPGGINPLLPLGLRYHRPLAAMRDSFQILRQLFQGQTISYQGILGTLDNLFLKPLPPSPPLIYMGARGPRMLELAGELADAVNLGRSVSSIPREIQLIQKGLKKSGRKLQDIEILMAFKGIIAADGDKARDLARPSIAYRLMQKATKTWHKTTFNVDEMTKINQGSIPGQQAFMDQVIEADFREYGVIGSPEEVVDQLRAMYKLGVTRFIWGFASFPNPEKAMHLIGQQVIPELPITNDTSDP